MPDRARVLDFARMTHRTETRGERHRPAARALHCERRLVALELALLDLEGTARGPIGPGTAARAELGAWEREEEAR